MARRRRKRSGAAGWIGMLMFLLAGAVLFYLYIATGWYVLVITVWLSQWILNSKFGRPPGER